MLHGPNRFSRYSQRDMIAYLIRRPWLAALLALSLAPLDVLGIAWFRATDHSNMEKYAYYANGALAGLLLIIAVVLTERWAFRRFGPLHGPRITGAVSVVSVCLAGIIVAMLIFRDTENVALAQPLFFGGSLLCLVGLFVLAPLSRRLIRGGLGWGLALLAVLLVAGLTTETLLLQRDYSPNGCPRPRLHRDSC